MENKITNDSEAFDKIEKKQLKEEHKVQLLLVKMEKTVFYLTLHLIF